MGETYHTVDHGVLCSLQVGTSGGSSRGLGRRPSLDGWNDIVFAISRCRVVERVDVSVERLGVGHAGVDGSLFRHLDS